MKNSPFDRLLVARFLVECKDVGVVLNRIKGRGVPVLGAKYAQNGVILSIRARDRKKLFAICAEMCYNIRKTDAREVERKSRPTFTERGESGLMHPLAAFLRRGGLALGVAAVFVFAFFLDGRVLGYSLSGVSAEARSGVVKTLEECGAVRFAKISSLDENELASAIVKNVPTVRFATVFKHGSFIEVETIEQDGEYQKPDMKDALSPVAGKIVSVSVLRGTPLVKAGDVIEVGSPLVGAYFTAGEMILQTCPIYKIDVECEYVLTLYMSSDGEAQKKAAMALAVEKCPESHIIQKNLNVTEADGRFEMAVALTYLKRLGE